MINFDKSERSGSKPVSSIGNSNNQPSNRAPIPNFDIAESLCSSQPFRNTNGEGQKNGSQLDVFSSKSSLTAYITKLKADADAIEDHSNSYLEKPRFTVGLVMLPSDSVLETEAPSFFTQFPGVMWRGSKIFFEGGNEQICAENYENNAGNLVKAAGSFFPKPRKMLTDSNQKQDYGTLDCVALSCTSLSQTLGAGKGNRAQNLILQGYDPENTGTVAACDMATAMKDAIILAKRNNKRAQLKVVLVTPYLDPMHESMKNFVSSVDGVQIVSDFNYGLERDSLVSVLAPQRIQAKVLELAATCALEGKRVDAVIICCSAFRSTGYGFIDGIERELGFVVDTNPCVITSNQALFRQVMNEAVMSGKIARNEMKGVSGYGRIMRMG